MGWLKDESGLERNAANHVALTPLSHLNRARKKVRENREVLSWQMNPS